MLTAAPHSRPVSGMAAAVDCLHYGLRKTVGRSGDGSCSVCRDSSCTPGMEGSWKHAGRATGRPAVGEAAETAGMCVFRAGACALNFTVLLRWWPAVWVNHISELLVVWAAPIKNNGCLPLQELAARKEAKAKAIAAKVATAQAAWQQEHAAKKAQVAQYQQQVAQQMAEAQEAAAIAAAEAAAAAQAALAAQQPAVAARQAERRDRLQQQLEQQRQRQAAMAERQARLDAIAKALAPNVPNDPQRLLQPTAASTATADPAGAAFKPVHGYTTAQVVADQRFRVVEALHAAVLLNTAAKGYVQQVVASVQPTAATRVDNLNTVQLQATTRHGR